MVNSGYISVIWIAAFLLLCIPMKAEASPETTVLHAHNYYRKNHKTRRLKLDAALSTGCAAFAKEMAAVNTIIPSRPVTDYGQNICSVPVSGSPATDPFDCAMKWYLEIGNYNFYKPKITHKTEHFTQFLWKNSRLLGVGTAVSDHGYLFVVARYVPPGNVGTEAELFENVRPDPNLLYLSGKDNLTAKWLSSAEYSQRAQVLKHLIIFVFIYTFVF